MDIMNRGIKALRAGGLWDIIDTNPDICEFSSENTNVVGFMN